MTAAHTTAWLLTALIFGPLATAMLGAGAICFSIAIRDARKSLHALMST